MADQPLILIVEDERAIIRFLKASLSGDGYRLSIAESGRQAQVMLASQPPDLIILDLGLPDIDGADLIDQVRQWSQLPIIVLSARDQERDKVDALDRGADDYLTKPFGVSELLARLRVALRHHARKVAETDQSDGVYESHGLHVDLTRRIVQLNNADVHLTPIEYRLMTTLIAHAGKVLTHRMLLNEVWGPGHANESHQLRVHMANLRRKIETDPAQPRHILTEQGVGYRLASDLSQPDSDAK